jgi:hypothetical protein
MLITVVALSEAETTALAGIAVAALTIIPSTLAAFGTLANRRAIARVTNEVTPNGGSSSYDLLHRLVWETHERAGSIPELVSRIDRLEASPRCPYDKESAA